MIDLFTAATPNGYKISIVLEELGLPYRVNPVRLERHEQKKEWFLRLNPNGRIPVIVDHENNGFAVFESGAILLYLAEKTQRLIPVEPKRRSVVVQWLMFQMGGIGPMQGQATVFYRYAPEPIPWGIARYQKETRRLYEVLERRLAGRQFLVDEYSIADIACFPWVNIHSWAGVGIDGLVNVQAWLERIRLRPAVVRGLAIPHPSDRESPEGVENTVETSRAMLV